MALQKFDDLWFRTALSEQAESRETASRRKPENPVPIRFFILHLQVSTFIMKNMKFTRQKVIKKEGGTVKNE